MKVLIDTHCLLWWLCEPQKLNEKAKEIFLSTENDLILSAVVSWEIAIKANLKRLRLPKRPALLFKELFEEEGFTGLPIDHGHTLMSAELPKHHFDPFDRLLIAQSQVERIPILTADKSFKLYSLELVWAG